jgi:hypothetical protein
MVEDGLWLSRKQRRSFHQPRLRRKALKREICHGLKQFIVLSCTVTVTVPVKATETHTTEVFS